MLVHYFEFIGRHMPYPQIRLTISPDRLEHGECVLDKDGQTRRVPVKARDAMLIAAISFDKRQIARSLPTSITDTKGGKLGMLRDQLAQVSGRIIEGEARAAPDAHTAPTDAS